MEENEHYEDEIRALTREDFVDAGPVEVAGQDYAIVGGEIITGQVYLVDIDVRLAGGAGGALVLDTDYTVDKRTGIITVVGGGALDGQTDAWVLFSYDGISNVPLRQLANRTKWLKPRVSDPHASIFIFNISGQLDDWDPPGWGAAHVVKVTVQSGQTATITGFRAPVAGEPYAKRLILAAAPDDLTLAHDNVNSADPNRLQLGADFVPPAWRVVHLFYDAGTARWRINA